VNSIDERKVSFVTLILQEVANHWWQMIQKVLNVYEEPVTWTMSVKAFYHKYFWDSIIQKSEALAEVQVVRFARN
jgi:hypothetical protein